MQDQTMLLLARLEKADWFARIGLKDTEEAVVLSSWQEAALSCSALRWEAVEMEASSLLGGRVQEIALDRYHGDWSNHVHEVKPHVRTLLRKKAEPISREQNLPKAFEGSVEWDILGACLELEYADICPPLFFGNLAQWYLKGHFPCGWLGNFPDGKLIIY